MLEITVTDNAVKLVKDGVIKRVAGLGALAYSYSADGVGFYYPGESHPFVSSLFAEGVTMNLLDITYENVEERLSGIFTKNTSIENLQDDLNAEIHARQVADDTLQGSINTETAARASVDNDLQGNIDAEIEARASADNDLQDAIDAEVSAREAAIAAAILTTQKWLPAVQTKSGLADPSALDATLNYLCRVMRDDDAGNNGVWQLVAGETVWVYYSDNLDFVDETELAEAVSAHNTAAAAHQDIRTAVSDEATARATADGTLQGNIDDEATARASADSTLQGNIDAEATARQTADEALQGNIDAEATARATADEALQEDIAKWVNVPFTADNDFDTTGFSLKYNALQGVLWFDFQGGKVPVFTIGMKILNITLPRAISDVKRFTITADVYSTGKLSERKTVNIDMNSIGSIQLYPHVPQASGAYPTLDNCRLYGNAYILLV